MLMIILRSLTRLLCQALDIMFRIRNLLSISLDLSIPHLVSILCYIPFQLQQRSQRYVQQTRNYCPTPSSNGSCLPSACSTDHPCGGRSWLSGRLRPGLINCQLISTHPSLYSLLDDGMMGRESFEEKPGRTPTVVRLAQCCSSAGYVEWAGADGCQEVWRGS